MGLVAHLRKKSPDCVYQMYTHKAKMGRLRIKFTFIPLVSGGFPAQSATILFSYYKYRIVLTVQSVLAPLNSLQ